MQQIRLASGGTRRVRSFWCASTLLLVAAVGTQADAEPGAEFREHHALPAPLQLEARTGTLDEEVVVRGQRTQDRARRRPEPRSVLGPVAQPLFQTRVGYDANQEIRLADRGSANTYRDRTGVGVEPAVLLRVRF